MQIKLIKLGKSKLETIKLIREFCDYSLKDSKSKVDYIPSLLDIKGRFTDFNFIKQKFQANGATVNLITIDNTIDIIPHEEKL